MTEEIVSAWVACRDHMPDIGQQVVLANANRQRSLDELGCVKDVGILTNGLGVLCWATQGTSRALIVEAFTHWMPLQDPPRE